MYINQVTMQEAEVRSPICPARITLPGGIVNNPDETQQEAWYQSQGWLSIAARETVPDGYRVTHWTITDLGDGTASLTIAASVNKAEEQAAADAAAQAQADADAQAQADADQAALDAKTATYAEIASVVLEVLNARNLFPDNPLTLDEATTAATSVCAGGSVINPKNPVVHVTP